MLWKASAGLWASVAVLSVSAVDAANRGELTLVRDGQPAASILLAKEPTRVAQLAAFELQHHVRLITGATLPIRREPDAPQGTRVLVGEGEATRSLGLRGDRLKYQEYVIRFRPNTLILMGRDKDDRGEVKYDLDQDWAAFTTWPDHWDEQGTLYAVYDFLERFCGVRWFNPTEVGTVCPQSPTLAVGGRDVRRAPFFRARNAVVGLNAEVYDAYTGLWPGDSDGYKQYEAAAYADLHRRFPDSWPYLHAKRATIRLFLFRMRAGGEKCLCNHSLYNYYQRFWEPSPDPNLAKLFVEKRPEMFAQGYEGTPPQMCYTSPELVQQVVQDARDYFDHGGYPDPAGSGLYPGYHWGENYFAVEPMDNASFCKCPRCQAWLPPTPDTHPVFSKGDHSDYFFQFVNAVAREVAKTHPHKRIVTLAYMTHATPPKRVRLEPNVIVHYCFASNRLVYDRKEYENDVRNLREWVRQYPDRPFYLWLYYTFPVEVANNGKWHCFPGYFAHTLGQQFDLFRRLKIRGMFHCGYGQEVEAYLTFKLMDDPTRRVDAVLHDYFHRYYGAAAEPMKKLYLAMEETYSNPKNYPPGFRGHQTKLVAWENLGTEQRMAQFAALVAQARSLARTDLEKRRIALFEKGTWEYLLEGQRQHLAHQRAEIPSLTVPRVADAGGDVGRVDWDQATPLGGRWYERGGDRPAARRLSGRIAHDGQFLYLELTDPCDTSRLVASSTVFAYDDWEVFVAGQRGRPYRQYAVGPTGLIVALRHGEEGDRANVPIADHGVKAVADVSSPNRWVTRLALPLDRLLPQPVAPGGKLYLNVVRVSSPQVTGGDMGIDSWVSYCSVHDLDRLAEVILQP